MAGRLGDLMATPTTAVGDLCQACSIVTIWLITLGCWLWAAGRKRLTTPTLHPQP